MKPTILVLALIVFTFRSTLGQADQLVLKRKSDGKERILNEGKSVKVVTLNHKELNGAFEIINDSLLTIGHDTLVLSDIDRIRTKSKGAKITGGILTGSGGFITLSGTFLLLKSFAEGGLAPIAGILIGIPMITIGILITTPGILFLTVGKKYKHEKWDYRVVLKQATYSK
jgi:hypothetical protein